MTSEIVFAQFLNVQRERNTSIDGILNNFDTVLSWLKQIAYKLKSGIFFYLHIDEQQKRRVLQ